MTENVIESNVRKCYNDLLLDLNLDQSTADDAWANYERIRLSYTLEGEQLPWLVCALYTAGRQCSVPTVGGRPGNMIQGNCVSLTRMLQHCNLPLTEFILKMKSWLAMSHLDEDFCRRVELLERNFAVSNNIFKKYKPIFLALFQDPANDPVRPQRSRKQRRPPCNATEIFQFCWTLYILIKGKYPSIPQDLVSCYSLLLACVDLIYSNVITSNRIDLLNRSFEGFSEDLFESNSKVDMSTTSISIMDILCKKFDGIHIDTKVIQEYYWKTNIKHLVENNVLKGTNEGMGLLDQLNFDHNEKEIKKAYEEYLLSHGEFDERMFLTDTFVSDSNSLTSSPRQSTNHFPSNPPFVNPIFKGANVISATCNLSQTFSGDHHLVPQTPITGRNYTQDRPIVGTTPLAVITSGLQRLYALISGRNPNPSETLLKLFRSLKYNPEEKIANTVNLMSEKFTELYRQETEDFSSPAIQFTKMRLQMGQILFYVFLEHILLDESKRGVDLEAILREDLFHQTLFTCSLEIVLKSYNDQRRFPWSLQVSSVAPYYFIRIIEPVIRSERQCENQLSRELVKHLKGIEEQIIDSLAFRNDSPLWHILENTGQGIPSCQDVNFSHQLEPSIELNQTLANATSIMSPAIKVSSKSLSQSPVSSIVDKNSSPGGGASARRMLFPSSGIGNIPRGFSRLGNVDIGTLNSQIRSLVNSSPTKSVVQEIEQSSIKTDSIESFLKSPPISAVTTVASIPPPSASSDSSDKKEKPKRSGSLALFFRKFYHLANMRLRDLCDRLDIVDCSIRQTIWTTFEHSIIHYAELMKDRHMDQMIMCAIYITCKVMGNEKIFQEIMKHYRNQPQAASHVYRSVLISRTLNDQSAVNSPNPLSRPNPTHTPTQMTGTSANLSSGERGDLIKFYNYVYVKKLKNFALRFRPQRQGDPPTLSPLPIVRHTPVSPRKKISLNHPVYINSFNSLSPLNNASPTPKRPLSYFINRSPAKNLHVINKMVKMQDGSGNRRLVVDSELETGTGNNRLQEQLHGVLQERQSLPVIPNIRPSPQESADALKGGAI